METISRYIATLLVMALMLTQSFSIAFVAGSYYLNKKVYSSNCENKLKPWMHCNGKCQMMKKMREQEKKDDQSTEMKTASLEVISSKSFFTVAPELVVVPHTAIFPDYIDNRLQKMPRNFFHPPDC